MVSCILHFFNSYKVYLYLYLYLLSISIYLYIYIYIYLSIYIYIYIYIYISIYLYIYISIYLYLYIYIYNPGYFLLKGRTPWVRPAPRTCRCWRESSWVLWAASGASCSKRCACDAAHPMGRWGGAGVELGNFWGIWSIDMEHEPYLWMIYRWWSKWWPTIWLFNIAIDNGHRNSEFLPWKMVDLSIAMLRKPADRLGKVVLANEVS